MNLIWIQTIWFELDLNSIWIEPTESSDSIHQPTDDIDWKQTRLRYEEESEPESKPEPESEPEPEPEPESEPESNERHSHHTSLRS